MISFCAVLDFGHSAEDPATTVWGAGVKVIQDNTLTPTSSV